MVRNLCQTRQFHDLTLSQDIPKSLSKAAAALTTATVLVKDAQDEYPGIAPQLEACNTECKRAKRLVDLTRKHKGLHTAGVMPMAEILLSAAEDIQEHITSLDSDQGKISVWCLLSRVPIY